MTTFYYDDTSHKSNSCSNMIGPTSTTTTQNPIIPPKSNFTNDLNGGAWLMTPLSSPLTKLEHQFYSAGTHAEKVPPLKPPQQPAPISTMSTPNRRLSNNNNPAWHSLWTTTSTSTSPWQNANDTVHIEESSSPIDLDFLQQEEEEEDSLFGNKEEEITFSREQRSQSVSVFPTFITNNTTAATSSIVDDYFSAKKKNRNNSISTATAGAIGSHRRRPSFQPSGNIWDFNYYPCLTSTSAFPVSTLSNHSESTAAAIERRHSIASTVTRPITPPIYSPQIQQLIHQVQQQQKIDEYFSPTSTFIDVSVLGKGLPINQLKENQLIYQVQFKVKYRTDYFYVLQNEQFSLNDMVIVEADRGYDIGKIIALVETKEQKKKSKLNGDHTIKRIFRLANQDELLTYELKSKDEEMALFICQAKINQKNLNMEVVEAEYQWDRRKLTFYFKANERIDFRELVRELFKIYKTRIWMCASNNACFLESL